MTGWIKPCSLGNCPEYRHVDGRVEIRDSARPTEVAWFRAEAWDAFVAHLLAGRPQIAGDASGVAAPAADPTRRHTTPHSPTNHTCGIHGGPA